MADIGPFEVRAFSLIRLTTVDTVEAGRRRHCIPMLVELDVTLARERIRESRLATGERMSFTAWFAACLGRAVAEHPSIHAMRQGRRLVTFADVDMTIVVEREVGGDGETVPMPYVVRRANAKCAAEIHAEIRAAQSRPLRPGEMLVGTDTNGFLFRLFCRLPAFVRQRLVYQRLVDDPFFAKRTMGTVAVTSLGTAARGAGGVWFVPTGMHPLQIALGGVARKPAAVGDRIEMREFLSTTIVFDHTVTDGAPVARFVACLRDRVESGHGLASDGGAWI